MEQKLCNVVYYCSYAATVTTEFALYGKDTIGMHCGKQFLMVSLKTTNDNCAVLETRQPLYTALEFLLRGANRPSTLIACQMHGAN